MPIYEYRCMNCNNVIELFTKDNVTTTLCPVCKHIAYRIISHSNFHLKGGGWAKDSYVKKGGKE